MKIVQAEAVTTTNHVAIRIDDGEDDDGASSSSSSCCAVCMEPSEWVVVGACGHREVCLYCAVRMRFFQDDRRCCICRAFCATVVVTTTGANNDSRLQQVIVDGGGSEGRRQSVFSEISPAFGGVIRPAGTHCWYHDGVAAYFDDRAPYEAVRNMCPKPLPLHLRQTGVSSGNNHAAPRDPNMELKCFLLYLAVMAFLGLAGGIPLANYVKHWLPKVAVVIGSGLLMAVCAYFDARRWWFSTSPELELDAQRS